MTAPPLRDQILARAAVASVQPTSEQVEKLVEYFLLLERWNQKINLTALPLAAREDATIDRLLIEPLLAAERVDSAASIAWFDFGSGGGSPAIPLKLVRPGATLTMVEAKERKSAFLREAVSTLEIRGATVLTQRIESLPQPFRGAVDLVTMRAVKAEPEVLDAARQILKLHGRALLFRGSQPNDLDVPCGFNHEATLSLAPSTGFLWILEKSS